MYVGHDDDAGSLVNLLDRLADSVLQMLVLAVGYGNRQCAILPANDLFEVDEHLTPEISIGYNYDTDQARIPRFGPLLANSATPCRHIINQRRKRIPDLAEPQRTITPTCLP